MLNTRLLTFPCFKFASELSSCFVWQPDSLWGLVPRMSNQSCMSSRAFRAWKVVVWWSTRISGSVTDCFRLTDEERGRPYSSGRFPFRMRSRRIRNRRCEFQMSSNIVATLPTLRALDLTFTNVTSEDLRRLAPLRKLEHLDLKCTPVDDAGLIALAELPALRKLNLSATNVTDKGLAAVAQIHSLELVYLYGTNITKKGLDELRSARPDIMIGESVVCPAVMVSLRIGVAG